MLKEYALKSELKAIKKENTILMAIIVAMEAMFTALESNTGLNLSKYALKEDIQIRII